MVIQIPMLVQCWASVVDGGPTLRQHWITELCLLGSCQNRSHCFSTLEELVSIESLRPNSAAVCGDLLRRATEYSDSKPPWAWRSELLPISPLPYPLPLSNFFISTLLPPAYIALMGSTPLDNCWRARDELVMCVAPLGMSWY